MPRPNLPDRPENQQQHKEDLAENASAILDRIERLLDRIEHIRHGPRHQSDRTTIEFNGDDYR